MSVFFKRTLLEAKINEKILKIISKPENIYTKLKKLSKAKNIKQS